MKAAGKNADWWKNGLENLFLISTAEKNSLCNLQYSCG